ncbi:MAG: hypothetical protein ACK4Z0_03625 [Sphingomonadaceae bacterium]
MGITMTNKRVFVLAVALGFVGGFAWVALARDAGATDRGASMAAYAETD